MRLYWSPASPYARKVRAVAREKRVADRIEEVVVDAFADPPELTGSNPLGRLPALVLERRKPEGEKSPTMAARWRSQLPRALDAMAADHAGLPSPISLGHIAFACALGYLDFRHPDMDWRAGRETLARWFDDIARRPSLADTVPR